MEVTHLENEEQKLPEMTPKEAHDTLCDILLDAPSKIKVGSKLYEIRGLRLASKLMISKIFQEIKILGKTKEEKEDEIVLMYNAIVDGTQSFEHVVRIAAVCINNHKFKPFDNEYNTKLIDDTVEQLMFDENLDNQDDLIKIVEAAVRHITSLKTVFLISSLVQSFSNALLQQRTIIVEQLKSVPRLSIA